MKRFLIPFTLGITVILAIAASVKISDLPLSTSPSTNTFLEIADMDSSTNKSSKILWSNLVTQAQITNSLHMTGTPAIGDVATASSTNGTSGVWTAPLWTNTPVITGDSANPIAGVSLVSSVLPGALQIQVNDPTNFSRSAVLFSVGRPVLNINLAKSNSDIYNIGRDNFDGGTLTNSFDAFIIGRTSARSYISNSFELYGFGESIMDAGTITDSDDIYAIGDSPTSNSIFRHANDIYAFGNSPAGNCSFLRSYNIMALGCNSLTFSTITNSYDLFFFGERTGQYISFTNCSDIYAIGNDAMTTLSPKGYSGKSHMFALGSGSSVTNNNDFVFGDNAYNYFFPGASTRFESLVTVATGISSKATDAAVAVTATGWTNSFGKAAVARFDGTAMTYTVYNNAGNSVYTNTVPLGHSTELIQAGGKFIITAGTGVSGTASPF